MDPLSITAAVASLCFTLVKTGKQLHTIFECFQEAHHSLFMIQTECTVLTASLSLIQGLFASSSSKRFEDLPKPVVDALESSILGSTMILSVLTKEVNGIVRDIEINQTLKRKQKAKYVWNQEKMLGFVQMLRGQSLALSLLLKAMDSKSVDRILQILESNREVFDAAQDDAATIREAMPAATFPASIAELSVLGGESLYDILLDKEENDENTPRVSKDEAYIEILSAPGPVPENQTPLRQPLQIRPKPVMSHPTKESQYPPLKITQAFLAPIETFIRSRVGQVSGVGVAFLDRGVGTICLAGRSTYGGTTVLTAADALPMDSSIYEVLLPLALSRLVDKGLLSGSDLIYDLLPYLQKHIHPDHKSTTLNMLFRHTSGFASHDTRALTSLRNKFKELNRVQGQEAWIRSHLSLPATQHGIRDCNTIDSVIMISILETVTSKTIAQVLKSEVFSPLGMDNTAVLTEATRGIDTPPAPRYPTKGKPGASLFLSLYGFVYSSLGDLCRLLHHSLYKRLSERTSQGTPKFPGTNFDDLGQQTARRSDGYMLSLESLWPSYAGARRTHSTLTSRVLASSYHNNGQHILMVIQFFDVVEKGYVLVTSSNSHLSGLRFCEANDEMTLICEEHLRL